VLGKRLIKLRGTKTQQDVANKLNISRARYSHYENERVEPDTEILNRMADYFNVSVDYLLGRTDKEAEDEDISVSFYGGSGDITEDEEEYLKQQLEQYRAMKKKFLEEQNRNK